MGFIMALKASPTWVAEELHDPAACDTPPAAAFAMGPGYAVVVEQGVTLLHVAFGGAAAVLP